MPTETAAPRMRTTGSARRLYLAEGADDFFVGDALVSRQWFVLRLEYANYYKLIMLTYGCQVGTGSSAGRWYIAKKCLYHF